MPTATILFTADRRHRYGWRRYDDHGFPTVTAADYFENPDIVACDLAALAADGWNSTSWPTGIKLHCVDTRLPMVDVATNSARTEWEAIERCIDAVAAKFPGPLWYQRSTSVIPLPLTPERFETLKRVYRAVI